MQITLGSLWVKMLTLATQFYPHLHKVGYSSFVMSGLLW